jgi:hypothetical protein
MGKDPSFPWYPNDFDRDLHACHSSTAGIWARLLNEMWWKNPRGRIRAPRESFPLLCGCTKEEFDIFLRENKTFGFADVTVRNGFVTVINRRMYRTDIARKKGKERVEKHRRNKEEMEMKRDCNLNVQAETPPPSSSSSSSSLKKEYTQEFESFWLAYPRQIEKHKAFKCWETRLKEGNDSRVLILAAKNYAIYCEKLAVEPKYIKHPATFLGPAKPFEDFLTLLDTEKMQPQVPLDKYGNPYYTVDGTDIPEIEWRKLMDKDAIEPNKDGTWKRILRERNEPL